MGAIALLFFPLAIAKIDLLPAQWKAPLAWSALVALVVVAALGIPDIIAAIRERGDRHDD